MSRIVYGMQPVREALRAHGSRVQTVWLEQTSRVSTKLEALARFATDQGASVVWSDRFLLDRQAHGGHHQGVVALAPPLSIVSVEQLTLPACPLLVVLDELEDPQNFGACIRSAVALGAHAVLWPEHHAAPLSPATFRASAGAVEHAVLCQVPNLRMTLEALATQGMATVGLTAEAESPLHTLDLTGPTVLVVGAEGKGLRPGVKRACSQLAHLPMQGPIHSLNASVALAIALYETARQRGTLRH